MSILIKTSENLRKEGLARHAFKLNHAGGFGTIWLDGTGTVLEVYHPTLRCLLGCSWRELEAYCKIKGWELTGPIKDYGSKT